MVTIEHIRTEEELRQAYAIREKVYVEELGISKEDEFDALDEEAEHFLARENKIPCGTARYIHTPEGIKLEKFAVLPEYRKRGIAGLMIHTMMEYIRIAKEEEHNIYLNALIKIAPLYKQFGFEAVGDTFEAYGMEHQKMVVTL